MFKKQLTAVFAGIMCLFLLHGSVVFCISGILQKLCGTV